MLGPLHDALAANTRRAWALLVRRRDDRSGLLTAAACAAVAALYVLLHERLPAEPPPATHRVPLIAGCCWNGVRLLFRLAYDDGWHVHPGSSLSHRLALAAAVSPGPWLAWLFFFHAPTHRAALLTLPLLVTLPLFHAPRLCAALLRGSPGLSAWCDDAHRKLWMIHSAATFPSLTPFPAGGGSDPCLAVSAWACILSGVVMPLMALHEMERRAERRRRAAMAAAAAAAQEAAGPSRLLARRRRLASQPSLASVPENPTAEGEEPGAAPQAVAGAAEPAAGPATAGEGPEGTAAEAGPLLLEASFLQWCLRPYFYSPLAWSAVALVLSALPLAVGGAGDDAPAGQ